MGKKEEQTALRDKSLLSILELNKRIIELGNNASKLNETLNTIQKHFDRIRNIPSEYQQEFETAKEVRLDWLQHAEKIEKEYENSWKGSVGGGVAGVGVGVAVAALGPTAAMGVATTFGVASTGTAISTLSGAAATNAALAWLGGGALAAGGGGMAAGNALLALAGPVGWALAGIGLIASGISFLKVKQEQKRVNEIYAQICKRDIKTHKLATVEINERIKRTISEDSSLRSGLDKLIQFGLDYSSMSKEQQYELGTYVNLVSSATALLTDPILGLQPKYSEVDFQQYLSIMYRNEHPEEFVKNKDVIVFLANLLYQINLKEKDLDLLGKTIKSNKKLLNTLKTNKKEFDVKYLHVARKAVEFKYVV